MQGAAWGADTCSATAHTCTIGKARKDLAPGGPGNGLARLAAPAGLPARYAAGARTILKLGNGQAKILHAFTTPAGLYGYTVQIGAVATRDVILYTTKNGKYFLIGGLFAAGGKNLSAEYAKHYLPAAELAPKARPGNPESTAASIAKTTWFGVGNPSAPKRLWFLFDPNCIFCHLTWEKLRPEVDAGKLLIRVVPVGFLKPGSRAKAAAILMAKDPAKAFRLNERNFNDAEEEGGISVPGDIPATISAEVAANTQWMQQNGVSGTPFLLWKGTHGQVHAEDGMPSDIAGFLRGVGR